MRSIAATTLTLAAALSLGACSQSEPTTTVADNQLTLNESDFPAEGNPGEIAGNSTLGFDNSLSNADAGLVNEAIANEGALLNGN